MTLDTTGLTAVLDTIRDFAIPLTVLRPNTQTTRYGSTSTAVVSVAGIEGHMQPMSDKELRFMPEGLNTQEVWNIWGLGALQEGDQIDDGDAPIVTVIRIKYWKEAPFWHAQGTRVVDGTALALPQVFAPAFSAAFR